MSTAEYQRSRGLARRRARRRIVVRWITAVSAVIIALCVGFVAAFAIGARIPEQFRAYTGQERPVCTETKPPLVLMSGSSTMEAWRNSATDLSPLNTQNIGVGGTTLHDQLTYLRPIVTKFAPKVIVMFAGSNDLAARGNGYAGDVINELNQYVAEMQKELPGTVLYFVSINVAPSRVNNTPAINTVNAAVSKEATADGVLRYIETNDALLGPDGKPDSSKFRQDQLHMNDDGYAIFAKIIEERLVADGFAKTSCVYPDGTIAPASKTNLQQAGKP